MDRKLRFVKLLLTQFLYLTLLSPRKSICFRTAIDEVCEAFNKIMTEVGYTQKFQIYDPTKQILLNSTHSTNFQYTFFTGLHFSTANSSSFSMNDIEKKSDTAFPPLHTKQTSSLRCSTFFLRSVNITHRLHWPHPLFRATHSFN